MAKFISTVEFQLLPVARKTEIESRHLVDTIGGGVCQVSSPVEKSDLLVELQVLNIERMMNIENTHLTNTAVHIVSRGEKNHHWMLKVVPRIR